MSISNSAGTPAGFNFTPTYENGDFNWLARQNGGVFDPVLFGDYRDSQNAVVSQDFGAFFNDAFPLPDLGSPLHNFNDAVPAAPVKVDLIQQVDATCEGKEEVAPVDDRARLMTCNKIWSVAAHLLNWTTLTRLPGIACNQWKSSEMARSMWTTYVASLGLRRDVRKAGRWLANRMWTRSWVGPSEVGNQFYRSSTAWLRAVDQLLWLGDEVQPNPQHSASVMGQSQFREADMSELSNLWEKPRCLASTCTVHGRLENEHEVAICRYAVLELTRVEDGRFHSLPCLRWKYEELRRAGVYL